MEDHSQQMRAAYHEAGHAVACYAFRRTFSHLSIVRNGQDIGRLQVIGGSRLGSVEAAILCLAGLVAELIVSGDSLEYTLLLRSDGDPETDLQMVDYKILARLTHDVDEAKAYFDDFLRRTEDFVCMPSNWAAIETLAIELVKHRRIGYRRAMGIIREAEANHTRCPTSAPGAQLRITWG